jgi:hypothetical protein
MNLAKRKLALLTTATAMLLVTGMKFGGSVCANTPVQNSPADAGDTTQAKIARAMSAGPTEIARSARIVDTDALQYGSAARKEQPCMPGNPKVVGDPPMCADAASMQWAGDFKAHKPKPTNTVLGITTCWRGPRNVATPILRQDKRNHSSRTALGDHVAV